jgi:hypothetical protein
MGALLSRESLHLRGAAMWIMSTPEALMMFTALVLAFVALAQG